MSRELMFVEHPQVFDRADLDPSAALRFVYRCYGFRLRDEIPAAGLIVAAQTDGTEPQPVSRDDYFANALDPVRGKAAARIGKKVNLRALRRKDNMLVFVFDG